MARIFAALVRHGRYQQPAGVPSAHLPYPLTLEGEQEARALAERLLELSAALQAELDLVLDSSTLLRAAQTASIAADELRARTSRAFDVAEAAVLAERSVGAAANLTLSEIELAIAADPRFRAPPPNWKSQSAYRLPFLGAESLLEAGARTAGHIEARTSPLADAQGPARLKTFVGHGGAFRHAAVVLGALPLEEAPKLSMYHCQPVVLERVAAHTFRHAMGAWRTR